MPHVTFIHGIANKPSEDKLITIWRNALASDDGINLATKGISSSMIYWADVLYPSTAAEEDAQESVGQEAVPVEGDEDLAWRGELAGDEAAFVENLAARLNFDVPSPGDDAYEPPVAEQQNADFERIPLPWFVKRRLMKALLRDVHHYLFNAESNPRPGETFRVQEEIRRRFVDTLKRDAQANRSGPHIVVSHSMGTVIAYDCLKRVPDCPTVDGFMTLGSPLGLDEIQDKLQPEWTRENGFPNQKLSGGWINVFDRLDPVAGFDPMLANDYQLGGSEIVEDVNEQNFGKWRHSIDKYLAGELLRDGLARLLGVTWS